MPCPYKYCVFCPQILCVVGTEGDGNAVSLQILCVLSTNIVCCWHGRRRQCRVPTNIVCCFDGRETAMPCPYKYRNQIAN
ncbi:hypothetical protein [Tychonema sp. LEGE 06208]|uniref:hypothetical protein n=1 Tax=Tychonema sp. LEGE 06208 TaxID=1828663 RepID=UPI00188280C9|nr:hypothetical protein [Tychonema sp. LEGE 06208]MBE9161897.1 hypothetical protein [Tychonema sp. LEGE 06208]